MSEPILGVIGGMGPIATLDFLTKVIEETPPGNEEDHIPMRIEWRPDTPNRQDWFARRGDDPGPALMGAVKRLSEGDDQCSVLAMPCNTTHAWYDELNGVNDVRFLHIAEACRTKIEACSAPNGYVGVLGTVETARFDIYRAAIEELGRKILYPDSKYQGLLVNDVIKAAKLGKLPQAARNLRIQYQALADRGAEAIILACTEIPIATPSECWSEFNLIDSNRELARSAVQAIMDLRTA